MKRSLIPARLLIITALIVTAALMPPIAHASDYKLVNDSDEIYICVIIYNGDDSLCAIWLTTHSIAPGGSASGSCDGDDCKFVIDRKMSGEEGSYCGEVISSCSDDCPEAITSSCSTKIANGDTCTYTGTFNDSEDQVSGDTITCNSDDSSVEYSDDRQIP